MRHPPYQSGSQLGAQSISILQHTNNILLYNIYYTIHRILIYTIHNTKPNIPSEYRNTVVGEARALSQPEYQSKIHNQMCASVYVHQVVILWLRGQGHEGRKDGRAEHCYCGGASCCNILNLGRFAREVLFTFGRAFGCLRTLKE